MVLRMNTTYLFVLITGLAAVSTLSALIFSLILRKKNSSISKKINYHCGFTDSLKISNDSETIEKTMEKLKNNKIKIDYDFRK